MCRSHKTNWYKLFILFPAKMGPIFYEQIITFPIASIVGATTKHCPLEATAIDTLPFLWQLPAKLAESCNPDLIMDWQCSCNGTIGVKNQSRIGCNQFVQP
jgi:hypothetical protein